MVPSTTPEGEGKSLGPKPKSVEFSRTASQTPPSPSALDFELSNSDSPLCNFSASLLTVLQDRVLNSSVGAPAQQSSVTKLWGPARGFSSLGLPASWLSALLSPPPPPLHTFWDP